MLLDKKIPFNYILKKIRRNLVYVTVVGLVVQYVTSTFANMLPEMPLSIPVFLGTAISVLLSFKISQSYDRWWEARKVWGAIVNDSRSFVLQLQTLINAPASQVKVMAYRQIAWCYSLGQSLRGLNPLDNLERFISNTDKEMISGHLNKPLALLQLTALELKQLKESGATDRYSHIQIDNTLVRLCDSMGKAERINSTVFPVTYRLFLHFTIYLFVILLSISLQDVKAIFEVPLLVAISSVFFLLEKTAYHLQDPFRNRPSDTSVTAIATTIEINIKQLLGETNVPPPASSDTFYIL
ncbi:bestrophin family protein [Foetidibacter luteolus]|uniref:bestrophin family protein n=1 Tax=Foetidibacter luteolus TaxID=2608880 RepID=UPI00129A646A|nr:bestrophin family ion channel [Foetidibacter luteolus]